MPGRGCRATVTRGPLSKPNCRAHAPNWRRGRGARGTAGAARCAAARAEGADARSAAEAELQGARAELGAAAEARTTLEAQLDALRRELQGATDARSAAEAELHALRDGLRELAAARDAALADNERLGVELHAAGEHEHDISAELDKLRQDRNSAVLQLAKERALREDVLRLRAATDAEAAALATRLASVEDDLGAARATLKDALLERNALKQALANATEARSRDEAQAAELKKHVETVVQDVAAARAAADAAAGEAAALRAALDLARDEHAQSLERAEQLEHARRALHEDHQSLRDQIARLQQQLADERLHVAEFEAQRESLREAIARADAGTQMITARHVEERATLERAAAELRSGLTLAEERWKAERAELEQALRARTDAVRRVAGSGVVGVATSTTHGRLVRCNDTLARLCGYRSADDLTASVPDAPLPFAVDWDTLTAQLGTSPSALLVEACVQHPDGRVAWLQASASAVAGGRGSGRRDSRGPWWTRPTGSCASVSSGRRSGWTPFGNSRCLLAARSSSG